KTVAYGRETGQLLLKDTSNGAIIAETRFASNREYLLRFSPDSSLLAVGHWDTNRWNLEILKADTLELRRTLPSSGGTINSLAFTPDNRYLALGYYVANATEVVDL